MAQPWKESYFGCFGNLEVCLVTCCCPCVQYGKNAEKLDGSPCMTNCLIYCCLANLGCCCLVHMGRRSLLRQKYGLQEDCGGDCFATCCCPLCAICQEAREMDTRGAPPQSTM